MPDKPQGNLELDAGVITRTIDGAVFASMEIVNFHLNALATADLSKPAIEAPRKGMAFRLNGPILTADQRRALHENWLLAKAFTELLRAVRHGLELAHVITTLVNRKHTVASNTTVAEFLKPFEEAARLKKFPELLAEVNSRLATTLDFADAYGSLQVARNCLEHGAGIVGSREMKGKDTFEMSMPRWKIFYMRGDEEIDLVIGDMVQPDKGKDHAEIFGKLEVKKRTFKAGERLRFTLDEFNDVAFACYHLGIQLASKIPRPIRPS